MKLEEAIDSFRYLESERIEDQVVLSAIAGTNILYSPNYDMEYNIKHRFECILFSSVAHLYEMERMFPFLSKKSNVNLYEMIHALKDETELSEYFKRVNFVDLYDKRYSFYKIEFSDFINNTQVIPIRLLSLIYDYPAMLNLGNIYDNKLDSNSSNKIKMIEQIRVMKFINYMSDSYRAWAKLFEDRIK